MPTWSVGGLDLLLCFLWLCWSSTAGADLPWDLDFFLETWPTKSSFSKLLLIEDIDCAKVLANLFSGLRDLCLRSALLPVFFCLPLLLRLRPFWRSFAALLETSLAPPEAVARLFIKGYWQLIVCLVKKYLEFLEQEVLVSIFLYFNLKKLQKIFAKPYCGFHSEFLWEKKNKNFWDH